MKKIFIFLVLVSFFQNTKAQLPYQVFYGNLHSHTSYSDGQLTPIDAYTYARDSAGLDFHAVTDHMEQLSSSEYTQMQAHAAQATTNGSFVAIFGYEWSSPYYGHVNVFNTTEMPSVMTYSNWSGFRSWLLARPNAFAQFNHPGDEDYFNNWYNFEYKGAALDTSFPLIEFQNIQQATDWYELALNNGWHLSPAWNQDNHQANWGNKNNGRAGVWATDLSLNSLFNAMRAGRTFATMDKNAYVWLDVFGSPMGQTIPRYTNMPFRLKLHDAENEAWQQIELVTSNGVVMSFTAQGNLDTIIPLTFYTDKYVFVRAIQADGDYVWSGPIYFTELVTNVHEQFEFGCRLYPNPAHSEVNIAFDRIPDNAIQISIYSISGQLVSKKENIRPDTQTISLDISDLPDGIYLVGLESNGIKSFSKLSVINQ